MTMKQKIVIKVSVNGKKLRPKAMKIAVGQLGVESVAFQGEEKDQLIVIGDGIDSIDLTTLLRNSMGFAELLSVGPPDEPKKEEKSEPQVLMQAITWPSTIYQGVIPYYTYEAQSYSQGVTPYHTYEAQSYYNQDWLYYHVRETRSKG